MRYLSVCSGIEAATVAWHPLGWTPVAFSEIEPFPAAVLAHHYPIVPNYGDMTKHKEWPLGPESIDLLVGGTPCQSFSVAGLRKGISDPRGGLMLTYLEIARRLRPKWMVWENVPGVLSSNGGRDFGSFLGALGELRYGWAYRVIDAQYCRVDGRWPKAVPQRRRRVFVVGCDLERDSGGRERAAEVLALGTGLRWHLAEIGKARKAAPADAEASVGANIEYGFPEVVGALTAKGPTGMGAPEVDAQHYVASKSTWWDGSDCAGTLTKQNAGGGQRMRDKDNFGAVLQPATMRSGSIGGFVQDDVGGTMRAQGGDYQGGSESLVVWHATVAATLQAVAFKPGQSAQARSIGAEMNVACTLEAGGGGNNKQAVAFTPGNLTRGAGPSPNADVAPTQRCSAGRGADDQRTCVAHAFYSTGGTHGVNQHPEVSPAVKVGSGLGIPSPPAVAQAMTVRRLTPRECERLQAFPDDYTLIPWRKKPAADCPDGPRYKALGNSMAVNCMAWIGERINKLEETK